MSEVNIVRFLVNICPKKLNRKHLNKKETGEEVVVVVVQTFLLKILVFTAWSIDNW